MKLWSKREPVPGDWFYRAGTKEYGPHYEGEILWLVKSGQISNINPVWTPGMEAWEPIKDVPVFAAQLPTFKCPFCGSDRLPVVTSKVSVAGWLLFLFLGCFIIGLLAPFVLRDEVRTCASCGVRLGAVA